MGGDVAVLNVCYILSSVGGRSGVEGEGDGRGCTMYMYIHVQWMTKIY